MIVEDTKILMTFYYLYRSLGSWKLLERVLTWIFYWCYYCSNDGFSMVFILEKNSWKRQLLLIIRSIFTKKRLLLLEFPLKFWINDIYIILRVCQEKISHVTHLIKNDHLLCHIRSKYMKIYWVCLFSRRFVNLTWIRFYQFLIILNQIYFKTFSSICFIFSFSDPRYYNSRRSWQQRNQICQRRLTIVVSNEDCRLS